MVTSTKNLNVLGRRVRRLREDRGWTQEELGKRAGLPQSRISSVESGKWGPTLPTIRAIAFALGVTLDDLAGPQRKG